jgi:hypothetical protein
MNDKALVLLFAFGVILVAVGVAVRENDGSRKLWLPLVALGLLHIVPPLVMLWIVAILGKP